MEELEKKVQTDGADPKPNYSIAKCLTSEQKINKIMKMRAKKFKETKQKPKLFGLK